jgi:hypothetical protein
MSRTLFENSKTALAFAGLTIFGAVAMVGTSENGGVLDSAVESVERQRESMASEARAFAEARSHGDAPSGQSAGAGSGSVFGEYGAPASGQPVAANPSRAATGTMPGPMSAPFSATAMVDGQVSQGPVAEAYISDREMTIEPE